MIYADHAASTPLCAAAKEAMLPFLGERFSNPSSVYRSGLRERQTIERARQNIANLIHCRRDEIYFTSGGSEGNTWAIWNGLMAERGDPRGRLIAVSAIEHHSLLRAADGMKRLGARVEKLSVDEHGRINEAELFSVLDRRPVILSVQTANNEVGTLQQVNRIGVLCRERGILFHTDAVQAAGHMDLSLEGIDMLTASGHKFGGPKGSGFLYIRHGIPVTPLIYGGNQEQGLRGGTEHVAGICGLAAALKDAMEKKDAEIQKLWLIRNEFCQTLRESGILFYLNGSSKETLPGICSITIPGMDAEQMVYRMDLQGVSISQGAACDQRLGKTPSHVLLAMGRSVEEAGATLRFSFGSENEREDGIRTAKILLEALRNGGFDKKF